MQIIEHLKKDHTAILGILDRLESVCGRLEKKEDIQRGQLEGILEFLQIFVEESHHDKEENVLFPAMIAAGFPKEGGPIPVMLQEHDQSRSYVSDLTAASRRYLDKGELSAELFTAAQGYIAHLRQHINKENNILYMMAVRHIPKEDDASLLAKVEQIKSEKLSAELQAKFERLEASEV